MKELGTMTSWRLYEKGTTDFALPTDAPLHLVGNVTGHPKFADDTCVRSVTVTAVDLLNNSVATGRGTYKLETIDEEYSEWLKEQNFTFPSTEQDTVTAETVETPAAEPAPDEVSQASADTTSPGNEPANEAEQAS